MNQNDDLRPADLMALLDFIDLVRAGYPNKPEDEIARSEAVLANAEGKILARLNNIVESMAD